MIYGNINQIKSFDFLEDDVKKCIVYKLENDLINLEKGTYEIDGFNLFVNIVEYETQNYEDRIWEAHKKYIDIHIMLDGNEKIAVNFIDNLEKGQYKDDGDYLPLEGAESGHVTLRNGDFLICYPDDGHMTGIKVDEKEKIKKAIFKVIIK